MSSRATTTERARRFCRALHEETRGEILRWATIDAVADRIGMPVELGRSSRYADLGTHSNQALYVLTRRARYGMKPWKTATAPCALHAASASGVA